MNIIAFVCKYMKFFSNKEYFCRNIYIKLNEIGCTTTKLTQQNKWNMLFYSITAIFFPQKFLN